MDFLVHSMLYSFDGVDNNNSIMGIVLNKEVKLKFTSLGDQQSHTWIKGNNYFTGLPNLESVGK